jgi:hypothetical protein
MNEKFVWKAEITFEGTDKEFNQLMECLAAANVDIDIPDWRCRPPWHVAGCMPIPPDMLLGRAKLNKIIEDMPRVQLKYVRNIWGGLRTAHLHIKDEVVLLDRDRFKTYVLEVAQKLADERVDKADDYIQVMDPINRLGENLGSIG